MKKIQKARSAGFLALSLAALGWMATATVAQAQVRERYGRDTLSNASYERMRQWAHELDEVARHAGDQARAQEGGYRGFRRDTKFLRSIDHFADRAEQFHERMDAYRTRPWQVDDEIDHLLRDAREVQRRLQRARFVDRHTVEDWNRVVDLLNRMLNEYRYPGRYSDAYSRRSAGGRYSDEHEHGGRYSDDHYSADLRQLARELEDRSFRASELADRDRYGYSTNLRHFSEQARDFRDQIENRRLSGPELRSQVNHLLEDAQGAHAELQRSRVSAELAAEWGDIVRLLERIRDLAV